ncbi:MAG: ATP-dependent Clp protease ATP-binding subunit [Clostridia bacterium]
MTYKFTNRAKEAIEIANDLAIELGHNYVGTEHLLYGLAREGTSIASKVLEKYLVTPKAIIQKIRELIGEGNKSIISIIGLTPRTKRIIENAFKEAKRQDSEYIGTEHLLIGIIKEGESVAIKIMMDLGVDFQKMYNDIFDILDKSDTSKTNNQKNKNNKEQMTLNQFGMNLTESAEEGHLDPVIGREKEITRVIQILSRRTKNNPCLIGEPGVGKTAIVEGLAQNIATGNVPDTLKNKKVYTLDISGMVAGAKYRGDFEDRIKKCLKEVKKSGDIILFIDEVHSIVGAGAAEGAIDAANILKPLLARGEIQLIGATTINEYRKYIEKDTALERRFQTVMVDEPTIPDTIKIIYGLRDKYEAHHNVKITDEAIEAAVNLSNRFIHDRFLPDKAIDLIDEAASKVKIELYTEPNIIKKQEDKVLEVSKEKEEAVRMQDFEKAAKLRDIEKQEKEKLKEQKQNWESENNKTITTITKADIADIISVHTGIPVKEISKTENEKLKNLEINLSKQVVGQKEAVEAVSKAIKRARLGLKDPNRPIGSFLFLGPTGVGKTKLSKALAQNLFGDENAMIRVDMSEFMEAHTTSKFIGSPPGYVGYEEQGGLTEKVRRKPYSLILFDEIEKAHPDVLNLLLQILEDGILTDSHGRTVDFKNTVIIMTSNIGARLITDKKKLGFKNEDKKSENNEMNKDVMAELKRQLKPEFINRIDEIIIFNKLEKEELKQIVDLMIEETLERLEKQNIDLKVNDEVKDLIINKGTDYAYGARPLRRALQNILEDKIAEEMLDGNLQEGDKAEMVLQDNKIRINKS